MSAYAPLRSRIWTRWVSIVDWSRIPARTHGRTMKSTHHTRSAAALTLALAIGATLSGVATAAPDTAVSAPNNPQAIVIDAPTSADTSQKANPYPSTTTMWGIDGPITDVNVDLNQVTHGWASDLDIVLKSPQGTAVLLVSDSCGAGPVIQNYWTIDDEAANPLPTSQCTSGSWKPSNPGLFPSPDILPAPAPLSHEHSLSAFDGENPNGTWQLFVHDDTNRFPNGSDHGVILNGFRVLITTQSQSIVVPAEADGEGPATSYPLTIPVSGKVGVIEDVFVYLHGIGHSRPDDLDILLVAPGGQKIMLMSDACGHFPPPLGKTWRLNDRDPAMSDNGNCNLGGAGGGGINFAPTDHEPGDVMPAPAPAGPYSNGLLRSLYGTNPNGDWKVYINDDFVAHSGYLSDVSISFELGAPDTLAPQTTISAGPVSPTRSRNAAFSFAANENGSTFQCKLDDRAWRACTSPRSYARLALGRHVFRVRATDLAGNRDASPATWTWRIRN